jgi:hypothetical protein
MGKARSGRGGSEVGVDVERLKVDMEDQSIREIINTNVALGSEIGARAHRFFSIWASQPGLTAGGRPILDDGAQLGDAAATGVVEAQGGRPGRARHPAGCAIAGARGKIGDVQQAAGRSGGGADELPGLARDCRASGANGPGQCRLAARRCDQ